MRAFRLALRGYSVALFVRVLCSHLARFAHTHFALCVRISLTSLARVLRFALTKTFEKKYVSIDWKCSETHKNATKFFTVMTRNALCAAQSPRDEAQLYLLQVTPRVPRIVHAKFHADRTKPVVRRGILIYWIQINSARPPVDPRSLDL